MTVADFLAHAELRLAQSGHAEAFATAVQGGADHANAMKVADVALDGIIEQSRALFTVLRTIAAEVDA